MHEYQNVLSIDAVRATQVLNISDLQDSLERTHRDVSERIDKARTRARKVHNSRTNVAPINFRVGDFVLVSSSVNTMGTHKLMPKWKGPRRIVSCDSERVYKVENLITKKQEKVHARRMILYRADMDGVDVDSKLMEQAEFSEKTVQIAKRIHSIRQGDDDEEVRIEWEGLPSELDWSWEPINLIWEDIPGVLEHFLHTAGNRHLKSKALASYYK